MGMSRTTPSESLIKEWVVIHRQNSQIHREQTGLRIIIPYWIGWPPFLFMVVWTAFAAYAADDNRRSIVRGATDSLVWSRLYFGEACIVVGMCAMLWMTLGREVISFRAGSFTVCRGMFRIGSCRTFDFLDVKDVRVGSFLDPKAQGKWDPSFIRAGIYFEYQGRVHRFGNELFESEAVEIVDAIRERHPQLVYEAISTQVDNS